MLVHKLLMFHIMVAAVLGLSVPARIAGVLIPLLERDSPHCNVCIVRDEPHDVIIQDFIRTFWTVKPVAIIHGSSSIFGRSVQFKCHLYIIVLNDHEKYFDTLAWVAAGVSWNLYAKFVFYTARNRIQNQQYDAYVRRFAAQVLKFGLFSAILIYHLTDTGAFKGFHIAPFHRTVNIEHDIRNMMSVLSIDHLRNIQKHPVRASSVGITGFLRKDETQEEQGPYISLLSCLADWVNGTAEWVHPSYHNYIDTMKDMFFTRKINVLFKSKLKSAYTIRISVPIMTASCFLVPEMKIESFFKLMYVPFSFSVWMILGVIIVICCLMSRFLWKHFPRHIILQVLFGASVSDHRMKPPERFTCFALIFLLFFLSESYLSLMISFMLENEYYPHLKTIDDLLRSNIIIAAAPSVANALQKDDPRYKDKMVVVPLLDKEFVRPKSAAIAPTDLAQLYIRSKSSIDPQTNGPKYYILPQTFRWDDLQHTVSRFEPLGAELQWLQVQLIESGIWDLWNKRNLDWFAHKLPPFAERTLQFDDLITMWFILAYGFVVSGFAFIMEWAVFWWVRRNGPFQQCTVGKI